jgi:hypothetical protein
LKFFHDWIYIDQSIVVKLFNAIEHGLKASAASAKRPGFSLEKDLAIKKTKKAFVDYLVGTTAATPPTLSTAETSVENNQMQPKANNAKPVPSNWSVIKEDYLLNESSLKNWDVEEE